MKKSKSLFAIMAVTYILIAIASVLQWITISENILLGLSLSALFSALSDIMVNGANILIISNEFDYIIQTTSKFLEEKISQNQFSSSISARNVKSNIETMSKGYKKAKHPREFFKNINIRIYGVCSHCFFILSIVLFIFAPFWTIDFNQSFSIFLTLGAFSAMCLNLYLGEILMDISEKKNCFLNKEQVMIQMAYSDFIFFLNWHLNYYEDYIATAKTQEDKPDAHT